MLYGSRRNLADKIHRLSLRTSPLAMDETDEEGKFSRYLDSICDKTLQEAMLSDNQIIEPLIPRLKCSVWAIRAARLEPHTIDE